MQLVWAQVVIFPDSVPHNNLYTKDTLCCNTASVSCSLVPPSTMKKSQLILCSPLFFKPFQPQQNPCLSFIPACLIHHLPPAFPIHPNTWPLFCSVAWWIGGSPCTPALLCWATLSHGRAGVSGGTTLCFPSDDHQLRQISSTGCYVSSLP